MRCESYGDANLKYEEFKTTVENFYHAHESYHAAINDEYEMMDSQEYFETEKMRIDNFFANLWRIGYKASKVQQLDDHKKAKCDQMTQVSNVQAKRRAHSSDSRVSKGSSTLSARLAIKAKPAALETERLELETWN